MGFTQFKNTKLYSVMAHPGEPHLLEMIAALHLPCCLACALHRWQEERHQNADDGDHDQEFDERETASRW